MSYKTTKKDFEVFKAECEKWIEYFGMNDWDFCFVHKAPENLPNCRAACRADYCGKLVSLFLSHKWDDKPEPNELEKCAFHEVCEVLLSQMQALATSRWVTEDEVEVARHTVIAILGNTLFEGKNV